MKPPATSAVAAEEASSGVCHAVGTGSGTSSGTGLPMAPAGTAAGMGGMTAGNRVHFHRAPGTRHPLLLRQHYPAHSPALCLTQKIPLSGFNEALMFQPFELGKRTSNSQTYTNNPAVGARPHQRSPSTKHYVTGHGQPAPGRTVPAAAVVGRAGSARTELVRTHSR